MSYFVPGNRKKRISFSGYFNSFSGLLLAFVFLLPLNGLLANVNESEIDCTTENELFFGETFTAVLSGMQEVCPKITPASGKITAVLHGSTLYVSGHFDNLSGNFAGAHIHLGLVGENGPVTLVLKPRLFVNSTNGIFVAEDNTFHLVGEQAWDLKSRRFYVNIHSSAIPSGELRGQLLPPADRYYHTNLLGESEVPANGSQAEGHIVYELNGNYLTATGTFSGLSGPLAVNIAGGAHIHHGFSGQNGPVDFVLTVSPTANKTGGIIYPEYNRFYLDHHQKKALLKEAFYVNIHSTTYPSGEIRGQVSSIYKGASYEGNLSGSQEVPSIGTNATGNVYVNYNGGKHLRVSGSFKGLSSPVVGAHIHLGKRGQNGPVVKSLYPRLDANKRGGVFEAHYNDFVLTQEQINALFDNGLYLNIHTASNRGGELRAQLIPLTLAKCGASFSKMDVEGKELLKMETHLTFADNGITDNSHFENYGFNAKGIANDQNFKVYPNPVNQELTVEFQSMSETAQMTITHVSGKQVLRQLLPANTSQQRINVDYMPVGVYLLTLQREGELPITKRLIKQ